MRPRWNPFTERLSPADTAVRPVFRVLVALLALAMAASLVSIGWPMLSATQVALEDCNRLTRRRLQCELGHWLVSQLPPAWVGPLSGALGLVVAAALLAFAVGITRPLWSAWWGGVGR
ncbi:MAG: hypothetical protein RJA98_1929 [Pseudomonadota bacterium]|jgi:hypothetical protein